MKNIIKMVGNINLIALFVKEKNKITMVARIATNGQRPTGDKYALAKVGFYAILNDATDKKLCQNLYWYEFE